LTIVDTEPLQACTVEVAHVVNDSTESIAPPSERLPITRVEVHHSNDAARFLGIAMIALDTT
jgi:hypothetical protein